MKTQARFVFVIAAAAIVLRSWDASALSVQINFCFRTEVDFEDSHDTVGDYWVSDGEKTAYGIRFKIIRNSDSYEVKYTYASDSTGCYSVALDNTQTYTVIMYSEAYVNGNYVRVRNNRNSNTRYHYYAYTSYQPSSSGTLYVTWPFHPTGYTWEVSNIIGTGAMAQKRKYGGMSGKEYRIYRNCWESGQEWDCNDLNYPDPPGAPGNHCGCDGTSPTCNPYVELTPNGRDHKFVMTHEIGHAFAYFCDENQRHPSWNGYDFVRGGNCDDDTDAHHFDSEEWQERGAAEGFAHFYAASVWNDPDEEDCEFYYYKHGEVDVNPRNCVAESGTANIYTCMGTFWIGGRDGVSKDGFLEDGCFNFLPSPNCEWDSMCSENDESTSNEYDWLRFWWNLVHDQGTAFSTVCEIWDDADPHEWVDESDVYGSLWYSATYLHSVNLPAWNTFAEKYWIYW